MFLAGAFHSYSSQTFYYNYYDHYYTKSSINSCTCMYLWKHHSMELGGEGRVCVL